VNLMGVKIGMSLAIKAPFTKQEVIELILKMKSFDQREQAETTYKRENALHPEWNLRAAFLALKKS